MLILDPDPNIKPCWTAHGVRLVVHTYLYMTATTAPRERGKPVKGDKPISIYVTITRGGIEMGSTANPTLPLLPAVMEGIDSWIQAHNLMAVWEREEATYKAVVGTIELPGVRVNEGVRGMSYDVPISTPPSAGPLLVKVEVTEHGAKGYLYGLDAVGEYSEPYCLSEYDLDYPITMDGIKDKVHSTFQAYIDHL